ncbi:endolytic transglycosylase MltG, partial [Sphingomonas sp.]|uniref:endolytic transglycosylase MltG n=1 Tax=Sphingomonas sp. TaxID=28214 RepID=UPI00333E1F97
MRKLGCLGLILGLAAIAGAFFVVQMWGGRGPLAHPISVAIAPGSSLASASVQLEKAGAIPSASTFRMLAKVFGSDAPIKAGEYRIPAHLSQADILKVLQGSKTIQRFVTIPEGWASVQLKDAIDKTSGLTGTIDVPAEGSILPDSYAFQRGDTRAFMVKRMQSVMTRYLA